MSLREFKKLKTRRAIQTEALRLFEDQGYDATTVDQIAAAAEVSASTFFRYFPTKEDVVIEDEYDAMLIAAFQAAPPGDEQPLELARRVIRDLFTEVYAEGRDRLAARILLVNSVPQLRARSWDNLQRTQDMLADLISGRTGRPAGDLAVQAFVGAVLGVLSAVSIAWANTGEGELPDLIDAGMAQLAAGLRF